MEATEIINPNGDVERTITLNETESAATLERLDPTIRAMVTERLGQNLESLPAITQISTEELERICDEAVGIYNTDNTSAITTFNTVSHDGIVDTISLRAQTLADAQEAVIESINSTSDDPDYEDDSWDDNNLEEIHGEEEEQVSQNVTVPLVNLNPILTTDTTARFSSAEWFDTISNSEILIGGAGGISSWLAMLLARTNVRNLILFDDDKVETVNLAGQFFGFSDVGKYKVEAVSQRLKDLCNFYRCDYYKKKYTREDFTRNIMMCGFDNMEARKAFFTSWNCSRGMNLPIKDKFLLLDARLAAETLQVYCLQGDDQDSIDYYHQHCLFSDEEADRTVCSYKQTSFMANMIAGTMVNLFVNWCANQAGGFRPVPFFIEYDAVTMQYKVKMNAV